MITYTHDRKYKLKDDSLNRIQACIDVFCNKVIHSNLSGESTSKFRTISFTVEHDILSSSAELEVNFKFADKDSMSIEVVLLKSEIDINEFHLKYFVLELADVILSGQVNEELKLYTVRTYNKIFNSHPIRSEVLINGEFRFLIKPFIWASKDEPLTEQIVMYDIEVSAVNVEHARSLAYNFTSDINAYLSVLLDIGFEMVKSEFRIFTIKNGKGGFDINRYRTGFADYELNLIVKDNHYGLKSIEDMEHVDSFHSGKTSMAFAMPKSDGGFEFMDSLIYDTISNSDFLEELFSTHKIKKIKQERKEKPEYIPIDSMPHYPSEEIKIPSDIRKYFKGISNLGEEERKSFDACCRMYNISLTSGSGIPTLDKSYKVCAIEALAKTEKSSFSDFLQKYSNDDFDKRLTDYFYTVRSSHFHGGKFAFDEFNVNFQREISFSFKEKNADYINFNNYIRIALVNWVKSNILEI
ncbi:hypothetical protein [Acinetobacter modestus]|uniref:hypothetical protein n=1 Tax=Acinetobacter modestus TaxID=1776740 RepID=UPI001F4AD06E|nr:hypothetical protein [Acinetobacter modestus]MCH7332422.1 hypothetical protein [Acinetobacter modestus]